MKKTDIKGIAELVGTAAIVASLIFVGIQLKQAQSIATAERFDSAISNRIGRNELVMLHSDVLNKANSGENLSGSEKITLEYLIDSLWAEAFLGQRARQSIGGPGESGPRYSYSRFLFENPGARHEWEKTVTRRHRGYKAIGDFSPLIDFDKAVSADLAVLDEAFARN